MIGDEMLEHSTKLIRPGGTPVTIAEPVTGPGAGRYRHPVRVQHPRQDLTASEVPAFGGH
ncbi:hypothetical protein ACWGH2_36205 [Streptomyces sp. NPDC054871]